MNKQKAPEQNANFCLDLTQLDSQSSGVYGNESNTCHCV